MTTYHISLAYITAVEAENEEKARDIFWAELPDHLTNEHIRVAVLRPTPPTSPNVGTATGSKA